MSFKLFYAQSIYFNFMSVNPYFFKKWVFFDIDNLPLRLYTLSIKLFFTLSFKLFVYKKILFSYLDESINLLFLLETSPIYSTLS